MKKAILLSFCLASLLFVECQSKSVHTTQQNPLYLVKEWVPNWIVTLPDTLKNDSLIGVVWLKLKIDKKSISVKDVSIFSMIIKEKKSNKVFYKSDQDSLNFKITTGFSNQIQQYNSFFENFGRKLSIIKNIEKDTTPAIYSDEIKIKLKF